MKYTIEVNFIDDAGGFAGYYGLFNTPQEAVKELLERGWSGPKELNEVNFGHCAFQLSLGRHCHLCARIKVNLPKDISELPRLEKKVEKDDFIGSSYPFGDLKLT